MGAEVYGLDLQIILYIYLNFLYINIKIYRP
jgi:hypothetical protein